MAAESASPSTATGPTKGEYQTLQELAAGGMGSVYLARATRGPHAGKLVALKRMHPHLERNPQFAASFFDEAWITAGLEHPNIVDTYDWGTDREGRYIALEFVAGESVLNLLKAVRAKGQQMPIDVVLFIVGKTAEALHAAHELRNDRGELRHLVHRDVTPSNVLISRDGRVKLIDFGVAKARERLQDATVTNTLKGKFGYMSPEQARGVKTIDRRSDLWSLGVVLWECLAGRRLFKSESELEILRMVTEDSPASVRTVRPEVPDAVDSLLSAVFAKNRDDRLGSCAEFADYLWAVFREEGYSIDERGLAQYFRSALPDRCASLDRLLAGDNGHIEPTRSGPASGSFNGTDARSGVAPMQARSSPQSGSFDPMSGSNVIEPNGVAATASVPAAAPSAKKNNAIVMGAVAVALLSLGGAGAVIVSSRGSRAPAPVAVTTTQIAAQPALQPAVAPANAANTAAQQPTQPAQAAQPTVPTNGRVVRVGRAPVGAPTRPATTITAQQTAAAMLNPAPSTATTTAQAQPTPRAEPVNTQSATNAEPPRPRAAATEPAQTTQTTAATAPRTGTTGSTTRSTMTLQGW
jgi:serine/threonine protein kinase